MIDVTKKFTLGQAKVGLVCLGFFFFNATIARVNVKALQCCAANNHIAKATEIDVTIVATCIDIGLYPESSCCSQKATGLL